MLENEGNYYLYRHIRLDTGEPFYIGIGTKIDRVSKRMSTLYYRAFSKSKRNSIWSRIIEKTNYEVEILLESNDYDFIKQKEIEFIALYGRVNNKTGILTNMTDGGEGNNNESKFIYPSENHSKLFNKTKRTKETCNSVAKAVQDRLLKYKQKTEGTTIELLSGLKVTIIEYITSENIIVMFEDGAIRKTTMKTLNKRKLLHPSQKKVLGINSAGEYNKTKNKRPTKEYLIWKRMMNDSKAEVCKDWVDFQIFADWMNKNTTEGWVFKINLFEDDIVDYTNSVFLPAKISKFFECDYKPSIGRHGKYQLAFNNKHVGNFKSIVEARVVYLQLKNDYFNNWLTNNEDKFNKKIYKRLINFKFS